MRRRLLLTTTALALAGFMISGCARTARPGRGSLAPTGRSTDRIAPPLEEADRVALEERVSAFAHFAAGISSELNSDEDAALDHFYRSAHADPENEELVLEVARRFLERKQPEKSVDLLTRATTSGATGRMHAWLAWAYTETGKTDEAIAANREALRKDPHLIMAYRSLSQLLLEKRQPADALTVLDDAAGQSSKDAGFWVDLAEIYSDYNRLKPDETEKVKPRILKALERAAGLKPQGLLLIQQLADGFRQVGELPKAEPLYRELLDRFPALPGLREKLAEIYLREGNKGKASDQLEAIVKANPRNEQAHYFLGGLAYEEKKFSEAEDHYEKALLLKPEFEPVYYDLAGLKIALNKPQEALEILGKARSRFKQSFLLEFYAGQAYARIKDFETAVKHYVQADVVARANEPQRTNQVVYYQVFYFQFGAALERNGDHQAAEQYFRKCLEKSPNFAEAMNYLGYMWAERGENLDEARKLIERAVELEPENAAFLDSLGWVLFKLNQPRDALTWLQKAIERAEEPDATLYDHLGDVHSELKEFDKAREAWRKAVELEPNEKIQKKVDAAPPATGPTE